MIIIVLRQTKNTNVWPITAGKSKSM